MAEIRLLDSQTIDKIAAGEVVERPLSVVKELVENSIDSGATAVTVEIKDGGTTLIRVTDNGAGIDKEQIHTAFLRHATSKIESAEDLSRVKSLGFRGEALSSICAVAMVEIISKTRESLTGTRYRIEGGAEKEKEEIGAPDGTTVLVRNLFYNTPVRKKFLKQPPTEGSYITDLMEHLAMCRTDVAFQYILNGQLRFHTSGKGDLKEVIYRIFGREISQNLIPVSLKKEGVEISGFFGKPILSRSNRNFETFYVNGRYIKSSILSKAVEEGAAEFLMQHKYPFCVLHFQIDTQMVDVNVHPTKMEVRFTNPQEIYQIILEAWKCVLEEKNRIPKATLPEPSVFAASNMVSETRVTPEPIEKPVKKEERVEPFETKRRTEFLLREEEIYGKQVSSEVQPLKQETLFEEKIISQKAKEEYHILGQVFKTYWLVEYKDQLLMIDQHAAHEKVKYERLMAKIKEKAVVSQTLMPPIVVSVTGKEEQLLKEFGELFTELGFEWEEFGGNEYALRGVPLDLYGCNEKEMFLAVLDELNHDSTKGSPQVIKEKIASMSCKAAVKGNQTLSEKEFLTLLEEMMTLENPYNCPHGRPTIISISQYEMEKKFKRV